MPTVQKITQQIVKLCQEQKAQELDELIDNFVYNRKPNQPDFNDILDHVANELKNDHTTAAWFCSFMSGEIESLVEESPHPIQDLSKLLLDLGFELLTDFTPNPNCQIVIYNTQKYNALPKQTKNMIDSAFEKVEKSMEIYVKDNKAIASEFTIIERDSG